MRWCARRRKIILRRRGRRACRALRRLRRRDLHQCLERRRDLLRLEPFARTRRARADGRSAIQAELHQQALGDPGRLHHHHPAAAGARHRHRRRLQDDGRGQRRPRPAGARGGDAGHRRRGPTRRRASPASSRCSTPARRRSTPTSTACKRRDDRRARRPRLRGARESISAPTYVNDFNYLGRTYRVTAQADGAFRQDLRDIGNCKTRSDSGGMVPLSAVASFRDSPAPTACRATTSIRPPKCRAQPLPGLLDRPGAGRDGEDRGRGAAARASASNGPSSRCRRSSPATPALLDLRRVGGVRLPAARGPVRELDAAARGDPDRADVPARRRHRPAVCAAWT